MTDKEKLDFIDDYNKAIQDSHQQDEIKKLKERIDDLENQILEINERN